MKLVLLATLISLVQAVNFDRDGNPVSPSFGTKITPTNQFAVNWMNVDPFVPNALKYTGAFMIGGSSFTSNNCGGVLLRTWDIDGTNPTAVPDPSLPAFALTSAHCFISATDAKVRDSVIINQVVTQTYSVILRRYENSVFNTDFSNFTTITRIVFANLRLMDLAIVELNIKAADALAGNRMDFYPLLRTKVAPQTPVTVITYLDPTFAQLHYMRATFNSSITSNETFTYASGRLTNTYAFGVTATFKSLGAPVLYVYPNNSIAIAGIAVEESQELTTTMNFGTWSTEIVNCWDSTGRFSRAQTNCLKEFALEYFEKFGTLLISPKFLEKENKTQVSIGTEFSVIESIQNALDLSSSQVSSQNVEIEADGVLSFGISITPSLFIVGAFLTMSCTA